MNTTGPAHIVTLTTDFGWRDAYVGSMKGVILSIAPHACIVDITHEIPPHDLLFGAMLLREVCPRYPAGTIHMAVVDPGVGGKRRPILLNIEKRFYIGPDNGLFSLLLRDLSLEGGWELKNPEYFLPVISATFHGRDIFASVAAYLATGTSPDAFGPHMSDPLTITFPVPTVQPDCLAGEILYIDRFGNCISTITYPAFKKWIQGDAFRIRIQDIELDTIAPSYDAVDRGAILAIFNGLGYLEIARNQDRADKVLHAHPGDTVLVYRQKS